jgi:hypothetical protein
MKNLLLLTSFVLLTTSAFAAEETWTNVPIVDVACSAKAKADPDAHTRSCALQCQNSGFGLITADGEFLKLDNVGNKKAITAIKEGKNDDHLRFTVTGTRDGNTVKVSSLAP